MHYHVVINRVIGATSYPTPAAAEAASHAALSGLRDEKENQGYEFDALQITTYATLATWKDPGMLTGWQMVESMACDMSQHETQAPMSVRAEVWGLSANDAGIWLINGGDAWRSGAISEDSDPHFAVEALLDQHNALGDAKIIHSTSWRAEDTSVVLTYVAALDCPHVHDHWPGAQLVSAALADAVGTPNSHAADEAPLPRYVDVLLHAIRHLRFLLDYDATAASSFSATWRQHLMEFAPALAGMYSDAHQPEVWPQAG
jgi:hypothetical protein